MGLHSGRSAAMRRKYASGWGAAAISALDWLCFMVSFVRERTRAYEDEKIAALLQTVLHTSSRPPRTGACGAAKTAISKSSAGALPRLVWSATAR
jgi:hypothetical protein